MKITDIRATTVTVPLEAPLRHGNGCHWGRFVRTIVDAPRALGDAKKTSTTVKGCPSTAIIIFRLSSFAPISAILAPRKGCRKEADKI